MPQAKRVAETFDDQDVVVIGLHTVFEHHSAQGTRDALAAFLHEYRITFPVGIDMPTQDGVLKGTAVLQFQPRFGKRLERDRVSLARTLAVGCPSSRQRNASQC